MAVLPQSVVDFPQMADGQPLAKHLARSGWSLLHRGKVRDTYEHPGYSGLLLVIATNRLSIFDIVLPVLIPRKGEVLTALTHFWLTKILAGENHHLVPRPPANLDWPRERGLLVWKVEIQPYELIFRYHIGGSVWKEYQSKGTAGGHALPPGLTRWQRLASPIFTPSTKAEEGHDANITAEEYLREMGTRGAKTVEFLAKAYQRAYDYARSRGILILDTKFEMGLDLMLADEVLTPDSSRFTTEDDFERAIAEGRDPVFYDKEPVRAWGREVETPFGVKGINNLEPSNLEHLNFVHNGLRVPDEVMFETSDRYLKVFEMLVEMPLDDYQRQEMGVVE